VKPAALNRAAQPSLVPMVAGSSSSPCFSSCWLRRANVAAVKNASFVDAEQRTERIERGAMKVERTGQHVTTSLALNQPTKGDHYLI
jgi:hypothetical protein